MDTTILVIMSLKNNWSVTANGLTVNDLLFSTNWFSDSITLPQITITPSHEVKKPSEAGPQPLYFDEEVFNVSIWIRPKGDSNTSYGFAKNAIFLLKSEIERIMRSITPINDGSGPETSQGLKHFYLSTWTNMPELSTRPIIFREQCSLRVQRFNG